MSWALFDFANSAFATIIQTFVFAAYFTSQIAPDQTLGATLWGNTLGIAGLTVALAGPVLGALTDQSGRRKPWLGALALLCIVASGLLWFVRPSPDYLWPAMVLTGLAVIGFELSGMLYNAMLPEIAPPRSTGRWSGWGWGLGYAGGVLSLAVAYVAFIGGETGWLDLDRREFEHVRATFVLVAIWFLVFSLPLFLFTPDHRRHALGWRLTVRRGLGQLVESARRVRQYSHLVRFFIARMIYIDGLATVFAFGGIYAVSTFGMNEQQVLLFGLGLNVSAGIGAASFAFLDDRWGGKRIVLCSLIGLTLCGGLLLLVSSVAWFWGAGLALGLFVGPVQASSRSYLARMAPPELRNQMFGLMTFSGKATAFLGPLLVGWLTYWSGSQRAGLSIVLVFFVGGFLLMLGVPADKPAGTREQAI